MNPTIYTRVMNADDLQQTLTYTGVGTADERVTQIVSSSATVGNTVTEVLTYAGSAGSYRIVGRTRSVS